jgi:hyperosmotically inducible periplasmic protein
MQTGPVAVCGRDPHNAQQLQSQLNTGSKRMNDVIRLAGVVLCLGLLVGCAAAVVGGAAAGGYYVGQDERTAGEIARDAAITSTVNARYIQDDLVKARKINVDTHRGVVTLYGKVESQAVASRAVAIARGVDGVRQVNSKLTIGE